MRQTEFTDTYGRQVIRREWHSTDGKPHRTTGSAVEEWTVLPGGAHVLSLQIWYVNGKLHREDRPAYRSWGVGTDGARVLRREEWCRHGEWHRVGGPAYRSWHVEPDGTRRLIWERWYVNGKLQRSDGPAQTGHVFYWHGAAVTKDALPWLQRGHGLLAGLTGATQQSGGSGVSPAWSRDARVAMARRDSDSPSAEPAPPAYRSAVGGAVSLFV